MYIIEHRVVLAFLFFALVQPVTSSEAWSEESSIYTAQESKLSSKVFNINVDLDKEHEGKPRWEKPVEYYDCMMCSHLLVRFNDRKYYAYIKLRVAIKWKYPSIDEYIQKYLIPNFESVYDYPKQAWTRRVKTTKKTEVALGTGEKATVLYRRYMWQNIRTQYTAIAYWATDVGTRYERWYWVWVYNNPPNPHFRPKKLNEIVPYILSRITPARSQEFGVGPQSDDGTVAQE